MARVYDIAAMPAEAVGVANPLVFRLVPDSAQVERAIEVRAGVVLKRKFMLCVKKWVWGMANPLVFRLVPDSAQLERTIEVRCVGCGLSI